MLPCAVHTVACDYEAGLARLTMPPTSPIPASSMSQLCGSGTGVTDAAPSTEVLEPAAADAANVDPIQDR